MRFKKGENEKNKTKFGDSETKSGTSATFCLRSAMRIQALRLCEGKGGGVEIREFHEAVHCMLTATLAESLGLRYDN